MTTPPCQLSPAAQKVLDALNAEFASQMDRAICNEAGLAAAVLRAVADQVVPDEPLSMILAIAAELDPYIGRAATAPSHFFPRPLDPWEAT